MESGDGQPLANMAHLKKEMKKEKTTDSESA
jgi:hypothetical protein